MTDHYFKYWGKASRLDQSGGFHLLPFHCLDVAAVAAHWCKSSKAIRHAFAVALGSVDREATPEILRAWILFFVALHDLGKFVVRFQLKAPEALERCWPELDINDVDSVKAVVDRYSHGDAGYGWFAKEYQALLGVQDSKGVIWRSWYPWIAAVTGHHGAIVESQRISVPDGEPHVGEHDAKARAEWFRILETIFLKPGGLSLHDTPPQCSRAAQHLIAGFCAVADWLGSNTDDFHYCAEPKPLQEYFEERVALVAEQRVLEKHGLLNSVTAYRGVETLLPSGHSPRGVQTLMDTLPVQPGLLIVEAPTGSGKTEAALAYAWRLLDAELADSIVFALPTQATANAMLKRVEEFAAKVFTRGGASVVLAHGKRDYNPEFAALKTAASRVTAQGREDALVQCTEWLAQSRKRVFLGQIGVCTVDQVLLSVLPIKHKFVRGFGVNKSVLIVDEVHAYDSYMHGLLAEVIWRQRAVGGSAILLSATLAAAQRAIFVSKASSTGIVNNAYPLVTFSANAGVATYTLPEAQQPQERIVRMECVASADAFPDSALIEQIVAAAQAGARVAVVCNLVDAAQCLTRALRDRANVPVDVFHARYRFEDRQRKELAVLGVYGKTAMRNGGRILVATQVVEQSLDLDFDWMVTQICPVDLLFQRLGRLHRHERERPRGFELPRCTVVTVTGKDYGVHKFIYENTRVLWRTEQLLRRAPDGAIRFPTAYREWIEAAYGKAMWDDEPENIYGEYLAFRDMEDEKAAKAQRLTTISMTQFADEDSKASALTRDGEMSLNVLPVVGSAQGSALLGGTRLNAIGEWQRGEVFNLNTVAVPATWDTLLAGCRRDDEGRIILEFAVAAPEVWTARISKTTLRYTTDYGLERIKDESA